MEPTTEKQPAVAARAGRIDAGLLLARMERQVVEGDRLGKLAGLLQKEALWRRLNSTDRLRWAQLAQMAAQTDTARRVLENLNREHPDNIDAWQAHLELLAVLGPDGALASLLARARPHIGETRYAYWIETRTGRPADAEQDLQSAAVPFERYHQRMAAVQRFMALFSGREDCFARQWANRKEKKHGYVPERRPVTPVDLEAHFGGRKTYGIYLMQADGRIRTAVIDADLNKDMRDRRLQGGEKGIVRREAAHMISRIRELSRSAGAHPLVEFSGSKGYHFWYFFEAPVHAGPVRAALSSLVRQVAPDLTAFSLEIFPKQDRAGGKGFGNLVKLPLGVHRANGRRSFFMSCTDRSTEAQLDFLSTIAFSSIEAMASGLPANPAASVVMHPRWKAWADAYPRLYRLQQACAPLAQVMSLCLDGGNLSLREEKILYQTIGFLPDGRRMLHYLMTGQPEYNPHEVDYRISRLRGTPLGCRRIHDLLTFAGPFCRFDRQASYLHPLLHIDGWEAPSGPPSEKVTDLAGAIDRLQVAIGQVQRFLK